MNQKFFGGIAMAWLASSFPAAAIAQDFTAAGPFNCTITRPRAVYSTQYHPRQVTMYRDVTETQMTHQNVVENIPITTCKTVTVDEGGYQMVWVSKPVTRQVAQTSIQQQVRTVSVPVQVQRRIPQTATQMVPVQTVQYVNETVPIQMTAMASTCSTCGNQPMIGALPQVSYSASLYQPQAYSATIPTMPAIDIPYQGSVAPTPRRDAAVYGQGVTEETVRARGVPAPQDEALSGSRKTSMFQGVPSTVSVWRRQEAAYSR